MAKLNWDAIGERYYERGVDRGALYVAGIGVAWPGLVTVAEAPLGGEARPFYLDGIKYLNLSSAEEYEATITAYWSPPEFAACDGVASLSNGLFATQQPRKSFGFSYRTKIGSDLNQDLGYKLHLVYNALAEPTERSNNTLNDSVTPLLPSWKITTLPPRITGYKPTAHFVVDSRIAPAGILASLEDILYGDDSYEARFPDASELITLFNPV